MRDYFVITGDIINSRNSNMSNLEEKINKLNDRFSNDLMTYFICSHGNKIQCIIKSAVSIPTIIRYLHTAFTPINFCLGIGYGKIESLNECKRDFKASSSWEMYGEVFQKSIEVMSRVKSKSSLNMRTYFFLENEMLTEILNSFYSLLDLIYNSWTERQDEIIINYDELKSTVTTAEKLNVSQQYISKVLKATNYREIICVEKQLSLLLQSYSEKSIEWN